ncbi:MAG: acetate--CoA ligase family protein, partial [Tateyamaria sp.]|nr:acetate--CoA ligase family protein [Tateyamaria sp.]
VAMAQDLNDGDVVETLNETNITVSVNGTTYMIDMATVTAADIEAALCTLNCFRLLQGYRGKPSANLASVVRAILALQSYVIANADTVSEVEINPLICTSKEAIAADALIRKA